MSDDSTYAEEIERLSSAKRDKAHAEGQLTEILKQIKEEHGLDSLDDAETELDSLRIRHKKLRAKVEAELVRLKKGREE